MRLLSRHFTEHPETVGETYFTHLWTALSFAFEMLVGGLACLLHGVFPFLFVKTGSKVIDKLHAKMVTHRGDKSKKTHKVIALPSQASGDV